VQAQPPGPIRPLNPTDDISALTALLHLSAKPLLDRGMQYLTGRQEDSVTARRIGGGRQCWVIDQPHLLATVTLSPPDLVHGCAWYDRDDVASVGQLAVHPDWQRAGLGRALMVQAEKAAEALGAAEVAIDTSEHAHHLIRWYEKLGYRMVGDADWQVTNYRSVVMNKTLRPTS
jgi:GNAT superfamily N-acetyltransferase